MFYREDLSSGNTLIVFHFQVHYTHVDESSFRENLIFVDYNILQLPNGVPSKPAYQKVTYTEWHILDVVLIQLIFLMMDT